MRYLKARERLGSSPQASQQVQTFLGQDELVRELESVEGSCGRIAQSVGVSGHDVSPLIIELNHQRFTLVQLAGKYTKIWPLSLDNRVTMVADQLGEASSVLSGKPLDVEHVRAHIDGAIQITRAFITELKNPPLVNNEKKSA